MASWKEERDRLVAQTLAFVQQVAAAHPGAARSLQPEQLSREPVGVSSAALIAATPEASAAISPALTSPAPVISVPSYDQSPDRVSTAEIGSPGVVLSQSKLLTPAMLTNHAPYSAVSARADITQRVAAFKARQSQISREREAYYETIQARIRTTLGNDSGTDRL